jgi:ribokinase
MKPIVVVGSINMDLVSRVEGLPDPGETIIGSSFEMHSGGKGANQAVAVARLGYPSILLGAVGDDIFGSNLLARLRGFHVDVSQVKVAQEASGTATIVVDFAGENRIIVVPAANYHVTPQYLESKRHILAGAAMVLAQLETPLESIEWLAGFCAAQRVPVMLDPAPAASLSHNVLRKIAWFTPNQTEASFYTKGCTTTQESLVHLFGMGIGNVVLKQGAQGVIVATPDGMRDEIPAFRVNALDTTAAGDAFNGAFAVSLVRGSSPAESARFAAAAAAISVTRSGAQPSLADQNEVLSFLRAVDL